MNNLTGRICLTPDAVYAYYQKMPIKKMEREARSYLGKINKAETLKQAEDLAPLFALFFLECCHPRLSPEIQQELKTSAIQLNQRYGPLADLLKVDPQLVKGLGHDFL